ncbi:MAG: glycosyltransferase family 39 protein [Acidobacteria bacterium]|nr:glycosyltransferase family 39 protein [Acidobacteriota bacterium]
MKILSTTSAKFVFLLLVIYIVVGFKLGDMAFVGADEPRYARVAEEMWRSGDYIIPRLHGKPWLEKPPLYYWLSAACYALFGVSEASARLPSALAAAGSVLLLWWVVRKIADADTALLAALVASTAPLFFIFGRAASTDSLFAASLSAGLLLWLYGFLQDHTWPYLAGGAAVGLAVLAKGPVALVLAAAAVVPALALHASPRRCLQAAGGLAVCLLTALPWYWLAIRQTGFEFISVFLLNHNLARFVTDLHHHEQPFYYYVGILVVGMYPWTLAVLFSSSNFRRSLQSVRIDASSFAEGRHWALDPRLIFLGSWTLLPLLFFSASRSKLPAYILPLIVPLSIIVALLLSAVDEERYRRRRRFVFASVIAFSLILSVAGACALAIFYHSPRLGAGLGLGLVSGSCLAYAVARRSMSAALLALAGSNVAVVVFLTSAVLPAIEPYHSTRTLVQRALLRLPADEKLYQYRTFHHTVDYYSGGRAVMESIGNPRQLRSVLRSGAPLYLLAATLQVPLLASEGDLQIQVLESRGHWSLLKVAPGRRRKEEAADRLLPRG